ncbi:uncharacterized protein [Diadema setosum]|uniref:uncharacterized protein n=1 Tax=Diadema setosum TaxID=31175 RepID=UPI003B3AFBDA
MLSDPTWQPHNEPYDESSNSTSGQVFRQTLVEEDPDALVFEDFLKFLYTVTVALTSDNVFSLVRLADKYMTPELLRLCHEFISNISSDVVAILSLLPKARAFNVPNVIKLCQQCLLTNFNLLSGQQVLDIDAQTMLAVIDSGPYLVVESEYVLFEKIDPWLTRCREDDVFVKIIKCIRFQFMNALQLLKVTTTAVFSRATEKLPDLPFKVWQRQTLFREGSHGDLPEEFPGPRLYLRPPISDGSENKIRGSNRTNEKTVIVKSWSNEFFYVSPWIKTVAGEKQIFRRQDRIMLDVLLTKVSQDQIKINVRLIELPFPTQTYTAMGIGLPNQKPKYFKASAFKRRSLRSPPTILKVNTKLNQPIEQDAVLQIHVALIMEEHEDDDSKSVATENDESKSESVVSSQNDESESVVTSESDDMSGTNCNFEN